MATINISVQEHALRPKGVIIGTRGSIGVAKLEFSFSQAWNGLNKKVTFSPLNQPSIVVVLVSNTIDIPIEVVNTAGATPYVITGYGADGATRISLQGSVVVRETIDPNNKTIQPTQSEIAQVYQVAFNAFDTVKQVFDLVNSSDFDGREVEIDSDGTFIRWRYVGEDSWNNLVALDSLRGTQGIQGIQGIAGRSLEFIWNGTALGVRVQGETNYVYQELRGTQGVQGIQGDKGNAGERGRGIKFMWQDTNLGIRYEGESTYTYTNLMGMQGAAGAKGDSFSFVWNGTSLGVRVGDSGVYSYVNLKGDNGDTGDKGTGLNYNWNGTSLGVKREDEANYTYVNLKGEPGSGGGTVETTETTEISSAVVIQQDQNDVSFRAMTIYGDVTSVVNPTVTVSGINLFDVLSAEWYNAAMISNRPTLQALSTYVVSKTAEKVQIRLTSEYYSGAGAIIQLIPGATYYMSNVFENTGVAADQYIKAGFYANRADVSDYTKCVLNVPLENNGSFTVPANAPYAVIAYILADETTAVKTAEIREIFLTRGAETKPYTPYIGKQTVTLTGITLGDGDYIGMTDGTVKSTIGGVTTDITNTTNGQALLGVYGYKNGTMIQFGGTVGDVTYVAGGTGTTENDTRRLKGKTVVNFGDSIFGNTLPPNDISTFLSEMTGATVHNLGFGGCRMSSHVGHWDAFSMYRLAYAIANKDYSIQEEALGHDDRPTDAATKLELLKSIDFNEVDYITIAYGTNDWTSNKAIDNSGNLHDTNTFAGAARYSIELLMTAFPRVKIAILSPTWRFFIDAQNVYVDDSDSRTMNNGLKLTEFVEAAESVAKIYHCMYIDNYSIGINKFNRLAYFPVSDGTHQNENGRQRIAENISYWLI